MRKAILYITTLLPFPPDMGGKIKTLSTLKQLIKKSDVYLFSFVDWKKDLLYEKELIKLGIKKCFTLVNPVIAEKHRSTQLFTFFKSLFTPKPYSVYKYFKEEMADKIDDCLKENSIDIFWVDHTIQTQYLPKNFKGEKILETHNFKTDFFKMMFFAERKAVWKLFSLYEWLKFKFYESKEFKKFDLVYAISEEEKKKIKQFHKNVKVLFPQIPPTGNHGNFASKKLFFVGLLTWYPNKQGIEWFIKEVFPDLKKKIPEITLDVVGDYSPKWKLPKLHLAGVAFHGYVRDISKFWQQASIFIVPLWYGAGVRIKILEALANGLPVVTTSFAAFGLPNDIKKRLFIADDKKKITSIIIKLLENKKHGEK